MSNGGVSLDCGINTYGIAKHLQQQQWFINNYVNVLEGLSQS